MLAAYITVTVVAAAACGYATVLNFTHDKAIIQTTERLGVPVSWMVPLGTALGAGAVGLITGFAVPAIGTAAACGLVLYFICAAGAHIRARDTRPLSWINWSVFCALSVAALAVHLAYRSPT